MTARLRTQPLIGVTPDVPLPDKRGEPLIVLQERYARAVERAGAVPVVVPMTAAEAAIRGTLDRLDGLVVSGGHFDIHPEFYGEQPIDGLGRVLRERTEFELGLLSLALRRDLPVLGICGGAQVINVALGGSLYQDLATQLAGAAEHQLGGLKDRGGHEVRIHDGTRLRRIVGLPSLEVNSTHHQAVKKLGKGLRINATAHDSVVEGIESESHSFVLGLQWHPEFLVHRAEAQRKIFAAFSAACRSFQPRGL